VEPGRQRRFSRMKKTYFQKFVPDKYNFYREPTQKTAGLDSTSCLRKSRAMDTVDATLLEQRKATIGLESRQQTLTIPDIKSDRGRDRSRDRSQERLGPSASKARLKTVVFQKNMDSLR
jgi:hypothetical protein